jgi:hypothetical protein
LSHSFQLFCILSMDIYPPSFNNNVPWIYGLHRLHLHP